jgi:hypothetical protein
MKQKSEMNFTISAGLRNTMLAELYAMLWTLFSKRRSSSISISL